jgi:hypothetical protein
MAINTQLQSILNTFATNVGGTSNPIYTRIQTAITSSPALENQYNADAASGKLTEIKYELSGTGAFFRSGENVKAIVVTQAFMADPNLTPANLVFVLGHEIRHATNAAGLATSDAAWRNTMRGEVSAWNSNGSNTQDLTAAVQRYVTAHLQDEGVSNIQGWNHVVSGAVAANGGNVLSSEQMQTTIDSSTYSRLFYTTDGTTHALRPGFSQNSLGYIVEDQANTTAAAGVQATQRASTASNPNTTYAQLYGSRAVSEICQSEAGRALSLDYNALGFTQPNVFAPAGTAQFSNTQVNGFLVGFGLEPGSTGQCTVINSVDGVSNTFTRSTAAGTTVVRHRPVSDPTALEFEEFDSGGALVTNFTVTDRGDGNYVIPVTVGDNTASFTAALGADGSLTVNGITQVNGQPPFAASAGITNAALAGAGFDIEDLLLKPSLALPYVEAVDTTSPTGFAPAPTTGGQPWYESDGARQFGSTLTATQSLIASLITGRPLPIATDVFSLAASLSLDPGLGQISQYLSAFNSLSNFAGALERGDSALALTNSGATFVKYALQGVQSVIEGQIAQEFGSLALARSSIDSGNELAADLVGKFDAIDIALKNVLDFLPWVNLFTAIERGDVGATISAALVLAGQPVLAAIVSFISFGISFTQSPPDIHGSAIAISSQDGVHLQSSLTSDSTGGGDVANQAMIGLISYFDKLLVDADGTSNGLGLIAQRLPQLYFKGYGNSSGYFDLTFRDEQTGQSYTRTYSLEGMFMGEGNGNGVPQEYNTSKDFFLSMGQQFLKAAEDAGALAPTWMVRTVDAQAARGDVLAGLTTEQRATALGQLLATNPGDATPGNAGGNTNSSTQTFRPLVLDLDGNGITLTTEAQGGNVLMDVDGDGFAEETQWVGPRDGILVLDRDGNGKIEGGHEMFNDSQVNSAARGLHALDEIDANGDGKITSADMAFAQIKVWQDVNHDGRVQGFELVTLSDKTITELNINTGQFVRTSGPNQTLAATALTASSAGYITETVGNSLLLVGETGDSKLLVSAVADYVATDARATESLGTLAANDGLWRKLA